MRGSVRGSARAFSLLETMAALAILAMIVALVVPAMASMLSDATGERAKGELTAAMADARSLARATSRPVAVSTRRDPGGEVEIVGVVLAKENELASRIRNATPEHEAPEAESAEPGENGPAGKRLAVLPSRCVLTYTRAADAKALGETDEARTPPAAVELAVVFPDGTASVSTRPIYLSVPGSKAAEYFQVRVSTWFGETSFAPVAAETAAGEDETADPSEPAAAEGEVP